TTTLPTWIVAPPKPWSKRKESSRSWLSSSSPTDAACLERAFVDAVLLHHATVHRFEAGVHCVVGLEDEAGLAVFEVGAGGGFEVFDVEQGGEPGVLALGLAPEEADAELVGGVVAAQEVPPAVGEEPAAHPLLHLVAVHHRDRHRDRLTLAFGDHEPFRRVDELEVERVGVEVLLRIGDEAPVL